MKKITKAVIPAAGLGTRFLPVTKALPKEMLPIIDIPNIHYIVKEAVMSGITDILIIVSNTKESIENYFDVNYELEQRLRATGKDEQADEIRRIAELANIVYVRQKEPRGLGDAIHYAKSFAGNDPIAVLLGDDLITFDKKPAIGELIDAFYKTEGGTILGCKQVDETHLNKYGVVKPKDKIDSKLFEIVDMVEKPKTIADAPSNVAVLGRYILPPEIFPILEQTKPGVGGEIQLTDAIKESMMVNSAYACIFTGTRYDIGDKFGYIKSIIDFSLLREDLSTDLKDYLKELVKTF